MTTALDRAPSYPADSGGSVAFAGTRPLLAVSLRQDLRKIAPWVALISILSASSILAYPQTFPDAQSRARLAATLGANPALALIVGPARDLSTADGFNAWRAGQLGAFFAGLMTILIVIRNSRANEDSGQAELVASAALARRSRLAVAVLIAVIASLALGVVCFVISVACGGGVADTAVLSATFVASGLMFAGFAAVAAQIGSDARTCNSIGVAGLGICYVLRGYLDSTSGREWLGWLTPLGWLEQTHPATGNNPWPLLIALALAVVLVISAFALHERRDFGQGLLAPPPGPAHAGIVGNIWGLAFRLQRGALISWLTAFVGLGLLFGSLASSIGGIIADNPAVAKILAAGAIDSSALTFAFLVTILQMLGIIAAAMGVQFALHIYTEEIDLRLEPLLAGSLRRQTYLASNSLIALGSTAVAMIIAGVGLGVVAAAEDDTVSATDVIYQSLATIPAAWVLVALGLAMVGAFPARRIIAWLGVVATFALTILGPMFKLPEWMLSISPLHHVPNVTASSPDWSGLAWLALVAIAFGTVAFLGFRRRDII